MATPDSEIITEDAAGNEVGTDFEYTYEEEDIYPATAPTTRTTTVNGVTTTTEIGTDGVTRTTTRNATGVETTTERERPNTVTVHMPNAKTAESSANLIFDDDWLKTTFIITDKDLSNGMSDPYEVWIKAQRYRTSADDKFTCTSPGMSLGVNPKPQFTRYADVRSKGRVKSRPDIKVGQQSHEAGLGMGGYYSIAIDDNQQRIFMRFGVPQYMPLAIWLYKAFDIHKTVLHGRGVITSTFLEAVELASKFFAVVGSLGLSLVMAAADVLIANSRFYSVKPTMYSYWATVENILNGMVARRTMLPHIIPDYTYKYNNTVGNAPTISAEFINSLSAVGMKNVVNQQTGRISVFGIALRAQATYNKIKIEHLKEKDVNTTSIDAANKGTYDDAGVEITTGQTTASASTGAQETVAEWLFKKAANLLMTTEKVDGLDQNAATPTSVVGYDEIYKDKDGNIMSMNIDPNEPNNGVDKKISDNATNPDNVTKWQAMKDYAMAELTEGAAFAVFNVEHTGSVGESFSSSFGNNPIESAFNSLSAKTGAIASTITQAAGIIPGMDDALKLIGDTSATMLSAATFKIANPLLALAYGVSISMPKIWEQSSANLPNATYKIKLVSPYGNAYSQLFNIYLPYAMLLAGSLPRSTGASSYVSPFFCQLYDRGRNNIALGMIRDLNVTRGTSNLSFSRAGHANAIDVEFSVANLDEIVAVDVSSSGLLTNAVKILTPDFSDSPFMSYLNTVTAVDVYTMTNRIPMIRLKLAEKMMNAKAYLDPDPAMFASGLVSNFPLTGLAKALLGDNSFTLAGLQSF